MNYAYCRVSTTGQDVEQQMEEIKSKHITIHDWFCDEFTGKTMDRPRYKDLCKVVKKGDTIYITKLDRFARSVVEGTQEVKRLIELGVTVHILNMGVISADPGQQLLLNIMLAFAEFERAMIVERTQGGKALAKQKPGFKEGRPRKHGAKIERALSLLDDGNSFTQVSTLCEIPIATLKRRRAEQKAREVIANGN